MRREMANIDIYNNKAAILYRKTPKNIFSWICILIILLITFIICSFIPFNVYKAYYGKLNISNEVAYFEIKLEYSDFPVGTYKKLFIGDKKYDYEIVNISNNVLTLKINLDEKLNIKDNITIINILKDRTTLFKIIKNKIKKGIRV